jgi:hypothetical protein
MKKTLLLLFTLLLTTSLFCQDQLYKVLLYRASPGMLLPLIDEIKEDMENHEALGIDQPYLLRHSQGDHWDLFLIFPIESMESHFSPAAQELFKPSQSLEKPYGHAFHDLVSYQEEAIVAGPGVKEFQTVFKENNLFHIEIFSALAGKQSELLQQRESENRFYAALNHPPNLIFTRVFGPSWDIFTIGAYKSLQAYADDGGITFEQENEAAQKAGFEGVKFIGSYLRSLLLEHHDTLANKVN